MEDNTLKTQEPIVTPPGEPSDRIKRLSQQKFLNTSSFGKFAGIDQSGNIVDFGKSQYDTPDIDISQLQQGNLNEIRAQRQSGLDKAANAVPRFVGRVATSAAEIVGDVYGLGKFSLDLQLEPSYKATYLIKHGNLDGYKGATWTTIFDNEVTKSLDALDAGIKELVPEYESKDYQNAAWYNKWKYANFYASDLVDAAAFATGSALTGAGVNKAISPIFKLAQAGDIAKVTAAMKDVTDGKITLDLALKSISKEAARIKASNYGEKFIQTVVAGTSESGQEARGIGKDFEENMIKELTTDPVTGNKVRDLTEEERNKISKLKDQAEGTGFLLNMLVVGPTNMAIQSSFFKKLKGLKEDKAIVDEVEGLNKPNLEYSKGVYTAAKQSKVGSFISNTGKVVKNNSEEAIQEMYQTGVQHGTEDYYQAKFHGKEGLDQMLKSTLVGFEASLSDEGLLSGLLGFLTPGVSNTMLTGGKNIKESLGRFNEREKTDLAYSAFLNKFKTSDVFKAAYEAGARHQVFQNQLDNAIENSDDFESKNQMHNIMTNLVLSRIDAGRIDDLKSDLEYYKTLSKEDFKDAFNTDLKEEDRDHVISFIQDKINKVNEIQNTRNDIKEVFGAISKGNQSRLIHATLAAKDSRKRSTDLSKEIKDIVSDDYTTSSQTYHDAPFALLHQDYNKLSNEEKVAYRELLPKSGISPLNQEKIGKKLDDIDKLKGRADNYIKLYNELVSPEIQAKKDAEDLTVEKDLDTKVEDTKKQEEQKQEETKLKSEKTKDGKPVVWAYTGKNDGINYYKDPNEKGNKTTYIPENLLDGNILQSTTGVPPIVNTPITPVVPVVQDIDLKTRILNKNEFNRFDATLDEQAEHLINSLDFNSPEVQENLIIDVAFKPFTADDKSLVQTHEIKLSYGGKVLGYLMNPDARQNIKNINEADDSYIKEQQELNRKLFAYLIDQPELQHTVKSLVDKGLFTITTSGGSINRFEGAYKDRPFIANQMELAVKDENGNPIIFDSSTQSLVGIDGTLEDVLPEAGQPAEGITDRYKVAITQSNGKIQWVGCQPVSLDEVEYIAMIKKLKLQSKKALKANSTKITDETINDKFNDKLKNEFFITMPTDELRGVASSITFGANIKGGAALVINLHGKGVKPIKISITDETLQSISKGEDLFNVINNAVKIKDVLFDETSFRHKVNTKSAKKAASVLQMNINPENPFSSNRVLFNFSNSIIPVKEVKKAEPKKVTPIKPVQTVSADKNADIADKILKLQNLAVDAMMEGNQTDVDLFDAEIKKLKAQLGNIDPHVFKVSDELPKEIIDIVEATNWLKDRLPSFINVKDLESISSNLLNRGATWGAFKDGLIYLSKQAGKGTEYHEAFHGVFRTLLNESDIKRYLKLAELERGKPTTKEVDNARLKYNLEGQSHEEISNLILEEYMADKFMDWTKDKNAKVLPGIKGLFQRILDWINHVLFNSDTMESLFYNIEKGSFKDKIQQSNRFNNASFAYKLLPIGKNELGQSVNLNSVESEKIFATTAMDFMKLKQTLLDTNTKESYDLLALSDSKLLDHLIKQKALSKYKGTTENKSIFDSLETKEQKLKFLQTLDKEETLYTDEVSKKIIKEQVLDRIKIFDFDSNELDKSNEDKANEQGDRFDVNASNIGGFGTLSKAIRQLIAFTSISEIDEFGRNVTRTIDVPTVYNGIERLLANTPKSKMMGKLMIYSEFNPEVSQFYNKLKDLVNYDEENDTWTANNTYKAFTSAFYKNKVAYIFGRIDVSKGKYDMMNANQRDVSYIQISRWANSYEFIEDKSEKVKVLSKLNQTYLKPVENVKKQLTANELKDASKALKKAFNDLGIDISEGLITYSILQGRKLSKSQISFVNSFDDVDPLQKYGKSDDNMNQIIASFTKGNPYIKAEIGEKEEDSYSRLKNIAESNAVFDESVGSSSFQNADGETVYDKILGSYTIRRTMEYQNPNAIDIDNFDNFKQGHPYLSEYDAKNIFELLKVNPLLNSPYRDLIFNKDFVINLIDGIRQAHIVSTKEGEMFEDTSKTKKEGKTFKSMQLRDTLLMMYGLSEYNKFKYNDNTEEKVKFSQYYFKVLEASNTGYTISLPEMKYYDGRITKDAQKALYAFFQQEFDRITRGYDEIAKIESGDTSIPVIKDVHNGKLRAINFWNFKYLSESVKDEVKKLAEEGKDITPELKETINKAIISNFEKELRTHIEQLVDLKVVTPVKIGEKVQPDRFNNVLLPSKYVKSSNKEIDLTKVGNFFFNDLINSWAFNQLIDGDWTLSRKDEVDWVKRNKGSNAMQMTFGEGTSQGAIFTEPITVVDGHNVKRADAQMYESLKWRMTKLKELGTFPKKVELVYNKIEQDTELTLEDIKVLEDNNATLISHKDIYFDGQHYFKLSSFVLTRMYTSLQVPHGVNGSHKSTINGKSYLPIPGRELEFNMQNELETKGIDYAMPESASKGSTKDVRELGNLKSNTYQNNYWGKQVETPSGKVQITDGTQKMSLIDSEQSSELKPFVDEYQHLLAQRIDVLFSQAKALLQNQLGDKEYTLKFVIDKFNQTLQESGADVNLIEFFSKDDNGNLKYNLNLPITIDKFEQLYYAHFTKNVLSVKAPGYALILKSDNGFEVARKEDGSVVTVKEIKEGVDYHNTSELRHNIKDADGNHYSEVVLPAHFKEMYNLIAGQDLPADLLKMLGIRIPTQDKQSMMTLKVVDFLPAVYGSIIIAPKEIILYSGADFDVDKLYVRRYDHYVDTDGSIKIYGMNGSDIDTQWKEFLISKKAEDNEESKASLKTLGLPSTKEEYAQRIKSDGEQNISVINNRLLTVELKLYGNESIKDIANTASSLKLLEDLRDIGIESKTSNYNINSINGKLSGKEDNDTGKENIGPSAIANGIFNLLAKNGIKLVDGHNITIGDDVYDSFDYVNKEGIRVNEIISTMISAMTDNAKERLAKIFNLTPDTLSTAMYMISLGVPLKQVMQITSSPIMQSYTKKLASMKAGVKTGVEDNLSYSKIANEVLTEYYDSLPEGETIEGELQVTDLTNAKDGDIPSNIKLFNLFLKAKDQTDYFYKINKLLQLNKGFDASVSENNKVDTAFNELGLNTPDDKNLSPEIPIDIRPLLKENSQFSKQIELYKEAHNKIAKEFFVSKSKVFEYINNIIVKNLKKTKVNAEEVLKQINRNLLSYLTINGYRNYLINNLTKKENAQFALNSLNTDVVFGGLIDKIKELKATVKNNKLLDNINIETTKANKSLNFDIIAGNNRVKIHPIVLEQILNGFNELYLNPETKQTAIDLFNYLIIKDGMQFKNRSISRFITPFMYKMVSESLYEVNDLVKKDKVDDSDFNSIFGKDKLSFIEEFIKTTFEYEPNTFDYIPFQKKLDTHIMSVDKITKTLSIDLFKGWEQESKTFDKFEEFDPNITDKNKKTIKDNFTAVQESNVLNLIQKKDEKSKIKFPLYINIGKQVYKLSSLTKDKTAMPIKNLLDALNNDNEALGIKAEYVAVDSFGDKNMNPFGISYEANQKVNQIISESKAKKAASRESLKADKLAKGIEELEARLEGLPEYTESPISAAKARDKEIATDTEIDDLISDKTVKPSNITFTQIDDAELFQSMKEFDEMNKNLPASDDEIDDLSENC